MHKIKEIFPEFDKPSLSVDLVILSTYDKELTNLAHNPDKIIRVLLIKDRNSNDNWRLPGSFMRIEESANSTIQRIFNTKVGLGESDASSIYTEQLYTEANNLNRDTRGRVVTILYTCIINKENNLYDLSNLKSTNFELKWHYIKNNKVYSDIDCLNEMQLDFDHNIIINDSLNRIKNKVNYTDIVFKFLNSKFTFSDFENTYMILANEAKVNLRRYTKDWMIQTEEVVNTGHHRPCKMFVQNKDYKF